MSKEGYTTTSASGIISSIESEVRTYSRQWPTVFSQASGSHLYSEAGLEYIDFFAGAGALNYGHNDPDMQAAMIEYIKQGNIIHGLDMYTSAKADFLQAFKEIILEPRGLNYRVQFPGPTGTNAVEAALKIARKVTGRTDIAHFSNSFHGVSLGSLALTGNSEKRKGAGVPLNYHLPVAYDNYSGVDGLNWLDNALHDPSSGVDKPAAVIVETVQGEGGINVASVEWLQRLRSLCTKHDMLLIVDDVQMGCGRTGEFFSFEYADIVPDVVVLSKSISGIGLPMALTLIKPEYDKWRPGEHNGTFRGNNLAFVTAKVALEKYWRTPQLTQKIQHSYRIIARECQRLCNKFSGQIAFRGRGLAIGIEFIPPSVADEIASIAYGKGLIVETCGPRGEVIKLLPALTISDTTLEQGLKILRESIEEVLEQQSIKTPFVSLYN